MDPDQAAVRRVLAGEVSAFRELVERHERALFVYLGNLARHPQDAEDLAQESFLTAYEQLARFDPARGAFSTWLFTLARRRALNHLAAARRRPTRPLDTADADEGAAPPADHRLPEHVVAGEDLARRLDAALDALPDEQRSAFVLARFVQLPYAEIAAVEGVEVGTVKSRVARARDRLRQQLPRRSEIF